MKLRMLPPVSSAVGIETRSVHTNPQAKRWLWRVSLLPIFLVAAMALQYLGGAYRAELGGYPDEPAHFVSGVMVKDYLSTFPPTSPLTFAKNYYVQRPKVAIGHWPPLFYLLQGCWFLLFGASRWSVLLLMALVAAGVATTVSAIVRLKYGSWAGLTAGLVFLVLPIVQVQTQEVMSDMLVALFGLWATLAFADYISLGRKSDLFRFVGLALLAISAKPSGLYLALLPPIAFILTKHLRSFADRWLWLSALLVGLPAAAWIWYSARFHVGTWDETPSLQFISKAVARNGVYLASGFGVAFSLLIGAGLYARVFRPLFKGTPDPRWSVLAAAGLSVFLFQSVISAGLEPRFLNPAISALIPFLFAGAEWLSGNLGTRRWSTQAWSSIILAGSTLAFVGQVFAIPQKPYRGFSEAADLLVSIPDAHHAAILVSSEFDGEGLLISELTMREPWQDGFVLRASKVLSGSDWMGRGYSARFSSQEELQQYLDHLPVDFVVIDQANGSAPLAHHRMLINVVRQSTDWRLLGSFPQHPSAAAGQGVLVYRRIGTTGQPDKHVRSEMEEILGRKLP